MTKFDCPDLRPPIFHGMTLQAQKQILDFKKIEEYYKHVEQSHFSKDKNTNQIYLSTQVPLISAQCSFVRIVFVWLWT